MSDAIKVVRACAIGGLITVLAAIAVAPVLTWWFAILALLAGFCGGYLSWEFREVLKAIPKTMEYAAEWWNDAIGSHTLFRPGQHPFFFEGIITGLVSIGVGIGAIYSLSNNSGFLRGNPIIVFRVIVYAISFMCTSVVAGLFSFFCLFIVACLGAKRCGSYWVLYEAQDFGDLRNSIFGVRYSELKQNYKRTEPTYRNVFKWQIIGLVMLVWFFVWPLWKHITLFVSRFLCKLFCLIHSNERLLCGFDGLLGGLGFAVWVWSDPAMPAVQKALMVGCGAMLGGMFGFVSYQFISIKWLKLVSKS